MRHASRPDARTLLACGLAIVGFAANSLLARPALGRGLIDPSSYTLVRLASGAAMLAALVLARGGQARAGGSWVGGAALAAYAVTFSFSYVRIGAALGALVLFPTVKITLLAWGARRGESPSRPEWLGAALALAGLVALVLPGVQRGDPLGIGLMVGAGVSWAAYTVEGRSAGNPLEATAGNFARGTLLALPLIALSLSVGHGSATGLLLAAVSGSVASALAYSLWYVAVPGLTAMQLGLAQLSVPVLAGLGAVLLLGEYLSARFLVASAAVLGGIAFAVLGPWLRSPAAPPERS